MKKIPTPLIVIVLVSVICYGIFKLAIKTGVLDLTNNPTPTTSVEIFNNTEVDKQSIFVEKFNTTGLPSQSKTKEQTTAEINELIAILDKDIAELPKVENVTGDGGEKMITAFRTWYEGTKEILLNEGMNAVSLYYTVPYTQSVDTKYSTTINSLNTKLAKLDQDLLNVQIDIEKQNGLPLRKRE